MLLSWVGVVKVGIRSVESDRKHTFKEDEQGLAVETTSGVAVDKCAPGLCFCFVQDDDVNAGAGRVLAPDSCRLLDEVPVPQELVARHAKATELNPSSD